MSAFLSIPRELRDLVIEEVVTSSITAPPELAQSAVRRIMPLPPSHRVYTAYSLLLTNWQLHAEVTEALERLRPRATVHIEATFTNPTNQFSWDLRPLCLRIPKRSQWLEGIDLVIHAVCEETYQANVQMLANVFWHEESKLIGLIPTILHLSTNADNIPRLNIEVIPSCDFLGQVRNKPMDYDDTLATDEPPWCPEYSNFWGSRNVESSTDPERYILLRRKIISAGIAAWVREWFVTWVRSITIWVGGGAVGRWEVKDDQGLGA
ncbi:hypothetical protein K458DRAFT_147093 [Lentithecium fluviatile CBS 122367]|uniref:F-box domain-containing protein n=1 Tax=Lentithecium fluviatile CBS 122367 TaxID=1168545 RepID=A0A6G1JCR1_9PLEO|nr:hypothetical protein K458DRAFT_147093 [Lentithecium fluviatile CBS 122367]